MPIPRPEYPRPLLKREAWLNLNGSWAFRADPENLGLDQHWYQNSTFDEHILVPYPVESEASGIGRKENISVVWYQREFRVPEGWKDRIWLHIGACDHWTRVFVNAQEVGQHRGGYSPISFDITHALKTDPGASQSLTLRVQDSLSWSQPRGKQEGTTRWPVDYDAVTGIWQSVWLEPLPRVCIDSIHTEFRRHPSARLDLTLGLSSLFRGDIRVRLMQRGRVIVEGKLEIDQRVEARLSLEVPDARLWSPDDPFLYDLELELYQEDALLDGVQSYTGLREISVDDGQLRLNGEPLYLRGVLDQGYFPGGWYTALTDADLRRDVQLTLDMGFNCARKHQKAEDPRYLYWADRLGLLVWSEMPSGRIFASELVETLTTEWIALMRRDRGHPCIMAWVPFNESWGVWNQPTRPAQRAFVDALTQLTRSLDTSRPVIGNDGWEFSSGDLWTLHLYDEPSTLAEHLDRLLEYPDDLVVDTPLFKRTGQLPGAKVQGLPLLITECGGVGFVADAPVDAPFAYGERPDTIDALEARIRCTVNVLLEHPVPQGYVWTQLTDVQQEINGLLTFERTPKLEIEVLRSIFSRNPSA